MKFSFKKSALTKSSIAATLTAIFSVTMGVILFRSSTQVVPTAHASSTPSLPMPSYTSPLPRTSSLASSKKGTSGQAMKRLQKRISQSSSSSRSSSRRSSVSSVRSTSSSSSAKKRPVRKPIFKKVPTKKS